MPCYHPLYGLRQKDGTLQLSPTIMTGILRAGYIVVSCGQCFGCKLERSRQWAVRIMHEAQTHESNSFITLTYDNKHLPPRGSLDVKDWQLFFKRLRKLLHSESKKTKSEPPTVRYFHAGEYGDTYGRPHYHACIFGLDFSADRTQCGENSQGQPYFHSPTLDRLWSKGSTVIGDLTFESAAYTARYCMKKITGDQAESHYEHVDKQTGECTQLKPEYTTMSRRPGIGKPWLDKFLSDVYPSDEVISRGYPAQPPTFYDSQYELEHPEFMKQIKKARIKKQKRFEADNTPERLADRETVAKSKHALYHRRTLD